jgi:hypothetical protein
VQLRESVEQAKDAGAGGREEELLERLKSTEARLRDQTEELQALRTKHARGEVVLLGGEQSAHNPLHPEQDAGALPPGVAVVTTISSGAPPPKACCAVQ